MSPEIQIALVPNCFELSCTQTDGLKKHKLLIGNDTLQHSAEIRSVYCSKHDCLRTTAVSATTNVVCIGAYPSRCVNVPCHLESIYMNDKISHTTKTEREKPTYSTVQLSIDSGLAAPSRQCTRRDWERLTSGETALPNPS